MLFLISQSHRDKKRVLDMKLANTWNFMSNEIRYWVRKTIEWYLKFSKKTPTKYNYFTDKN